MTRTAAYAAAAKACRFAPGFPPLASIVAAALLHAAQVIT